MFNSLSPQGRSYCGLGILTADGLFFLTAIFFILGGECWRFAPIFAPPVATDEARPLFEAYAKEAAENDRSMAADRKLRLADFANIALKEPDPKKDKQDKVPAVLGLLGESRGRDEAQAGLNQVLRQTYREKLEKAFDKKIAETERYTRAHERDGWLLSILASILVLFVSWAIARAGIRLLRSDALRGTVFEKPSQEAPSREDGRITNG